jgi:hypothetical protein
MDTSRVYELRRRQAFGSDWCNAKNRHISLPSASHILSDSSSDSDDEGITTDFVKRETLSVGSLDAKQEHEDRQDSADSETTVSSSGPEICVICGGGHHAKTLMQCCACAGWIHLSCYNRTHGTLLSEVPESDIICTSDEACAKGFQALRDAGLINEDPQRPSEGSLSATDELLGIRETSSTGSATERFVENILRLKERREMVFASLYVWSESLRGLSKAAYNLIIESISHLLGRHGFSLEHAAKLHLLRAAPPSNIRRVLEACNPMLIHSEVLALGLKKGVEVFVNFHFRNPVDAAYDLHRSVLLRTSGPIYRWNDPLLKCSAKRLPDFSDRIRQFCEHYGLDEHSKDLVVIPVYLYADESVSKSANRKACPLWMTSALIDPTTRAIVGEHAHSLIGFLPVASSLDFRFRAKDEGEQFSSRQMARCLGAETGSQREEWAQTLRLKGYEAVFSKLAECEDRGHTYIQAGREVTVRTLVVGVILDMKERRFLLNLRANKWHCMTCYDFPGRSLGPEEPSYGMRKAEFDEYLRSEFQQGISTVAVSENPEGRRVKAKKQSASTQFNSANARFGIRLKDSCPITCVGGNQIFLEHSPSELCHADLLHEKDGVILNYMAKLGVLLGEGFVKETMRFGNEFLSTKRYSMHLMEKGIESFHFIPLALFFGSFEATLSQHDRKFLALGA